MYNIGYLILSFLYYFLFFIIPIYCRLKFKDKVSPTSFLKLSNSPAKGVLIGLLLSSIYILLLLIKNLITGWKTPNFNIGVLWISFLFVGILEEIPFRGFLLQKLKSKTGFFIANLITSFLFVIMHYPLWISNNINLIHSSISIYIVSLLYGYIFNEFDSLWITIVCHSFFNLTTWLGFR
ncbi:CPBP family intramembrane metalloprotease [Clostridium sp. YIM B02505]|uniref:CPBP family intramembrane metalloprotease n=2 Tax=Clostridium yunnanense TaxID=2800325 RepID=A0ABS1EWP7_9CLOT|nr:CPBP family intramembrane glutamic endopeptidase [Clostridium yunnanense]MBK1813740.1 CPBP family intramembrane metalloprotease [Clostridium yunnanense]